MRRLLAAALILASSAAFAQKATIAPNAPAGDSSNRIANTKFVSDLIAGALPLTAGNIYVGSVGNVATGVPMGGDCTIALTGVVTCLKTNGVAFAAVATSGLKADVGLGSVTNDVQTKAAVVPNTAPSAGQVPVGNAGGTAYAPASLSGDCTLSSAGVITCTKINGTTLGTGVLTALGTNVGSAGAFVVNGGALGTPTSGVATNLTGTASGLTAGNVTTNANLTGDVTSVGNATTIAANAVTNADIRQSSGLSVVGRSASTTGNVADLTGTADQVLRVAGAGASLGFGAIDLSKSAAVGASKLGLANGGTGSDLSATGGSHQVLQQTGLGGGVIVGQLSCADLSNSTASCSVDATNATNIVSGTLGAARLPAFSGDVTTSAGSSVTTLANIPTATPAAGSIVQSNIASPSSPASGKVAVYSDSTDLRFHDKNAAGVIGTTVVPDTGASSNFLTGVSAAGVISKARPTCSSLSDSATSCATDATNAGNISAGNLSAARMSGLGMGRSTPTSVNLNSSLDQPLTIVAPAGSTNYRANSVLVSNPSTSMTTAVCGIWTSANKTGTTLLGSGSTGIAMSGLTTNTAGASGSLIGPSPNNQTTALYNSLTLFWNCTTIQGSTATADVVVDVQWLN